MLPGGVTRRNGATLLLTVVLLVAGFGTAIGSVPAGVPGDPPTSAGASPPPASTPTAGVVHPDLRNATGEVTVVVRFPELDDAPVRGESRRERGTRMRSHAADTQAAFDEFVAAHDGVTVDRSFWVANAKLVTVDTDAVALGELAAVDGVREIHPNYRIRAASAATTSGGAGTDATGAVAHGYRTTYGLEQVRAPAVWDRFGTKGEGVSVAVLDSGVDPTHPDVDIDESRWAEFDDDGDRVGSSPYDSGNHGTHTSATVTGGNASGTYVGVAPEATLYHGKVLEGNDGTWAAVIAGVEWAATEAEVDVISMSLGADTYYSAFVEPIRRANDLGVVVVASTGNNGEGTSNSPANSYDTIAVGAVDEDRDVATYSGGERVVTADAWGSAAPADWPDEYVVPDVVAPGEDVLSAEPGGGYGRQSGTSMATPHVAGVVALIQAAAGDHLSPAEVRDLLERTAREPADAPPGKDTRYGAGVVDAYAATARATADSTVTGRVVGADGDPVGGSRVATEFDYGTEAAANGTYRLDVPSLAQTLTVDAFGYAPETVVVSPAAETFRRDIVLSTPTLVARTTATPPERVEPGETLTYEFAVSNVTAVTVDALAGTRVDRGRATLRVDGEAVAFGERRTYAEPKVDGTVTVEVETTAGTVGALGLEATFEDGNASVSRQTARTHVHPDPLRVPADYDPADLQSAVDVAAPGTTLVVDERASGPYPLSVEAGATGPAGLSIRKPLTVTAAPGARPVLAVADSAADGDVVAVESTADGVEFSGLAVDGNGAAVGLRTRGETSVTDASVRNASVGFELLAETRARNVTLDGHVLGFDARNVSVSTASAPAPAPDGHERVGPAYDVAVLGPSPRADLAVGHDADAARLDAETVRPWRYDGAAGGWTAVADSRVETAERRVVASLDRFGTVAPMAERRPAEFAVDGLASPSTVVAGETVTANVTVTSAGDGTATGDVELRLDGEVVAAESVTLEGGETARVSLEGVVDRRRSAGSAELAVATAHDVTRTDLEVIEPPRFAVGNLTAPAEAERGAAVEVTATVENAGDRAATQRLELRLGADLDGEAAAGDHDVLATDALTLAGGASTAVTFAVDVPADADVGSLQVGVFGTDADARAPIEIVGGGGTDDGGADDGSDARSTPADDRSAATDASGSTGTPEDAATATPTDAPPATGTTTGRTSGSPTEDDGAGFGVGAALLAALAALLVARRPTR